MSGRGSAPQFLPATPPVRRRPARLTLPRRRASSHGTPRDPSLTKAGERHRAAPADAAASTRDARAACVAAPHATPLCHAQISDRSSRRSGVHACYKGPPSFAAVIAAQHMQCRLLLRNAAHSRRDVPRRQTANTEATCRAILNAQGVQSRSRRQPDFLLIRVQRAIKSLPAFT